MCFLKSFNLIFLISILSKNNCPSGISIVLPNAVLCRCPPLSVIPLSPTIVLKPSGKPLISSIKPAFTALCLTLFLEAFGSPNFRLSEIVDVNKNAS